MSESPSEATQSLQSRSLASAGSHQEVSSYEYQPLPNQGGSGHIRRLILESGSNDDPLIGRLEIIELKDAPDLYPFQAISYAWGSKNPIKDTLMIDGRPLAINASLGDALRQVRKPDEAQDGQGQALWADEICIHQNDDDEKGNQVRRMGDVYKASGCTLICLGPGLEPQDQWHAREVATLIDDVNAMMAREFEECLGVWDSFPYPQRDDPLVVPKRWESWNRLTKCEWFRRGWVCQEAALGPNGCVFWAGVEISWIRLLRAYYWWALRGAQYLPGVNHLAGVHLQRYKLDQRKEAMTFYKEHNAAALEPMSTLEMLDTARTHELTEPKDRIYAFMAMPTSDQALSDLGIQPDYEKKTSHLKVYQDFGIRYLAKTRDLNLLCYVEHDGEAAISDPQLPSWVPRWDRGGDVSNMLLKMDSPRDLNNTSLEIQENRSVLHVKGIVLDSVLYVSENEFDRNCPGGYVEQIEQLWREFRPQSDKYPGPHQSRLSLAFLVATCRGRYAGELETWVRALKAFAWRLETFPDQPMGIDTARREDAQRISNSALPASQGRRLILLSRGYYGVAPRVTRKGDICAIIDGTVLPLLLRKVAGSENHYKVLGPAYVQSKCNKNGVPRELGPDEENNFQDWLSGRPPPPKQDIFLH